MTRSRVRTDCASGSVQSTFETYFLKHALAFEDEEEHRLEYTSIYETFQTMFDEFMDDFLKAENLKPGDFIARCKEVSTGCDASAGSVW
jgi:hypothetical protein